MQLHKLSIMAGVVVALFLFVAQYAVVQAGLYDDESGATYKEIWVDHKEFTGGCGADERPFGTWYVEPRGFNNACQKVLDFQLPNDFSNASKIEIYVDIWRGHNPPSVRFALNGNAEHASSVGYPWSRTPLIMEIPKSELMVGANTIKVWNGTSSYHIHDIAFRLYYPPAIPLAGQTPPNAQLLAVIASNGVFTPTVGGTLDIDNDQIKLVAGNVSANAKFIEFHAYYDGYDEDNDGKPRDWHNRGRNNCHPDGATSTCDMPAGIGGTIDHIGTLPVTGASTYTMTWNLPYVQGQAGVRFKLRVVSSDNNARDAAGGVSAPFTLRRTKAVTVFTIPNFVDYVLHDDGRKPDTLDRYIELPDDVLTYNEAYIIGSYWKNPFFKFNDSATRTRAFDSGQDDWQLSRRPVTIAQLVPGINKITYEYNGGYGQFIEKPGPMIVLRRTNAPGADNTPPWAHRALPESGSIYIDPATKIKLQLYDSNSGVDINTIDMTVNGLSVTPQIVGDKFNYQLSYAPNSPFLLGTAVTIVANASDLSGNAMAPYTFSFTIRPASQPAGVTSDDFNACALETNLWTFVNPTGDASYTMLGDKIAISVPAGVEHDIWSNKKTAPRIVQSIVNGDFEAIVKFDSIFNLAAGVETQGLLVGNDTDFIRFDTQFDGSDIRVFLRNFEGRVAIADNAKSTVLTGNTTPPAYLRIVRKDPKWTFYYSTNGTAWTKHVEFNRVITVSEISVFVANGGNTPAHTGIIDYFFNADSPINPEDPNALILPINVVGNGTVNKDAECGNPVTLTAVPAAGWQFDGFTGATTSADNPLTFAFAQNDTVTANFSEIYYSLDIRVVDETGTPLGRGGTVAPTAPANPLGYLRSEALTLTATTDPGWTFLGWSGSAGGTEPVVSLVVQSNIVVTGTFEQEHYALNLSIVDENGQPLSSGGAVAVNIPTDPEGYIFGETASLTVTTEPGWIFLGWSGDLTGTAFNEKITFEGPKTVVATFQQEHYALTLAVVDEIGQPVAAGGPSINVTAPTAAAGYVYGETADLTIVSQPGWSFLGWSGDLSGVEGGKTLTFDGAKSVTATFHQERYPLTLAVVDLTGQPIADGPTVTVTASANGAGYIYGEIANLTVINQPGWVFSGWSGDLSGTATNETLTFDGPKNVVATFQQEHYAITVMVVDDGGVPADAATVNISAPASTAGYVYGEQVTITLTPKNGWNFFSWDSGLTGSDTPVTFSATGSLSLKAIFTKKTVLNIRYNDKTAGLVTATPVGPYDLGQQVQISVIANPGWQFTEWSGDLSGNANPTQIIMDANKTVQANFALIDYSLALAVGGVSGSGSVVFDPDQTTYHYGDKVTITATPADGWDFDSWTITPNSQSGVNLNQPVITIEITADTTVKANFTPQPGTSFSVYLPILTR